MAKTFFLDVSVESYIIIYVTRKAILTEKGGIGTQILEYKLCINDQVFSYEPLYSDVNTGVPLSKASRTALLTLNKVLSNR